MATGYPCAFGCRCELFLMWSPQGTYLTTFHVPGIALWGGERFEKQGRFPHKDVKVCLLVSCILLGLTYVSEL